ncbi:MAG TPA: multiheme c-type cytochrome, partial [Kofleriaceae bacterium]|nr:multiheme c-type cytochrome [Kofleriaceae bacterium]
EQARAQGPVLVVDAGSLLYSQSPLPAALVPEETLKANLLASIYQRDLKVDALGLGPADLALGASGVKLDREVANVTDQGLPIAPAHVTMAGGVKVGTFGVIAPGAVKGIDVADPVAAGKRAVSELRGQGAAVVIALVQASSKKDAVQLVRDIGGIDFAVAGLGQSAPEPDRVEIEPTQIGDAWLVIPANRGQVVSRVDVYVRDGGPFADAIGAGAATAKAAEIDREIADLDADLARFAHDPTADPKFVAQKQRERAQLVAKRDRLRARPLEPPARGSFFTLDQLRIAKGLACAVAVQDAVTQFDLAAGQANVKAADDTPVPPVDKGQASYVGMDKCDDCHHDAVEFWTKTVHAQAWQTLVDRGQQFSYECINCHITGWEQPGGTNLAHNENLRNIQCETCHGPASIHVAKHGDEKPPAIRRGPAEELCATQCHTHEHSDTFQHDAYMRDIVGPGHGEALRKKLGDGPTGHELRKAALDKAGRALGAGCTR